MGEKCFPVRIAFDGSKKDEFFVRSVITGNVVRIVCNNQWEKMSNALFHIILSIDVDPVKTWHDTTMSRTMMFEVLKLSRSNGGGF